MKENILESVSKNLNISKERIKVVISLLSEGSTIPFIARYRKEMTGSLNEEELRAIETVYNYEVNLTKRKDDVKRLIDEKGMLTPELSKEIDLCNKLSEIENIYLPFKEKRKTKGTEAIKMGLEPLAKLIMTFPSENREEIAKPYLNDQVKTVDEAIINAGYIIADTISNNITYHKWIREYFIDNGLVKSTKKKNAKDENLLYEIYYDFSEKIDRIKSYRVFAICRAESEGIVNYGIEVSDEAIINYLNNQIISNKTSPLNKDIELSISDAYKRLIKPSMERELKTDLFDMASGEGVKEFGNNLEQLLLTPPIKASVVMGFDPAFRTGCKLAIVNEEGDVLAISVIYPHEPKKLVIEAKKIMLDLIKEYHVKIISIGNGTASRESELFVSDLIKEYNLDVKFIIVSESGASVYSASPLAKKEFPDYSVEQRSAVSIARRLQDALSELVKIDPKSIGVGLYQHDLKPKELDEELTFTISKVVNKVGVNINNASESILNYISGLNKKSIKAILEYKKKKGRIKSRKELQSIKVIDAKTFEQSAGFLRVINGDNPLDKTNIHPEDYELVNNILNKYHIDINTIGTKEIKLELENISNQELIKEFNISNEKADTIKTNLIYGVIDPREELNKVSLRSDILTIDDLKIGDSLEGTVRNVAPFGAFVDIGLHDDALIHISKMSESFINHPNEILKVGDIVKVYISAIEKEKNRVSLSLIQGK